MVHYAQESIDGGLKKARLLGDKGVNVTSRQEGALFVGGLGPLYAGGLQVSFDDHRVHLLFCFPGIVTFNLNYASTVEPLFYRNLELHDLLLPCAAFSHGKTSYSVNQRPDTM